MSSELRDSCLLMIIVLTPGGHSPMSATGTRCTVCVIRVLETDLRVQAVVPHGIKHSVCASALLMRNGLNGKGAPTGRSSGSFRICARHAENRRHSRSSLEPGRPVERLGERKCIPTELRSRGCLRSALGIERGEKPSTGRSHDSSAC